MSSPRSSKAVRSNRDRPRSFAIAQRLDSSLAGRFIFLHQKQLGSTVWGTPNNDQIVYWLTWALIIFLQHDCQYKEILLSVTSIKHITPLHFIRIRKIKNMSFIRIRKSQRIYKHAYRQYYQSRHQETPQNTQHRCFEEAVPSYPEWDTYTYREGDSSEYHRHQKRTHSWQLPHVPESDLSDFNHKQVLFKKPGESTKWKILCHRCSLYW